MRPKNSTLREIFVTCAEISYTAMQFVKAVGVKDDIITNYKHNEIINFSKINKVISV